MATDPIDQYRRNQTEYNRIADALSRVRNTFESADRSDQKTMLFDSSVFAVMSVQNDISILRRAFRGYAQCDGLDDLREVMKGVNYGNNKFDYIKYNRSLIRSDAGDAICNHLENGSVEAAVDEIQENLKGLSWIKAAFVPAMLGFTEVMCIDTNVAQMVPDDSVKAKDYRSAGEYSKAVEKVKAEFPELNDEVSTFMLQWVVFDANRSDGVARHEEWFEQMLPGTPFGRQMVLQAY